MVVFQHSSIRRVRFEGEDVEPLPMMVRSDAVRLIPGTLVEVQVGARIQGRPTDRPGHWILCEVVTESLREVLVKVLTQPKNPMR